MSGAGHALKRVAVALFVATVLGGADGHCQSIQLWPEIDLSLSAKETNLLIPSLARFDSNLPNPQFVATGAIGTLRLSRRWSLSAGYLFADLPQHDQVAHVPWWLLPRPGPIVNGRFPISIDSNGCSPIPTNPTDIAIAPPQTAHLADAAHDISMAPTNSSSICRRGHGIRTVPRWGLASRAVIALASMRIFYSEAPLVERRPR